MEFVNLEGLRLDGRRAELCGCDVLRLLAGALRAAPIPVRPPAESSGKHM